MPPALPLLLAAVTLAAAQHTFNNFAPIAPAEVERHFRGPAARPLPASPVRFSPALQAGAPQLFPENKVFPAARPRPADPVLTDSLRTAPAATSAGPVPDPASQGNFRPAMFSAQNPAGTMESQPVRPIVPEEITTGTIHPDSFPARIHKPIRAPIQNIGPDSVPSRTLIASEVAVASRVKSIRPLGPASAARTVGPGPEDVRTSIGPAPAPALARDTVGPAQVSVTSRVKSVRPLRPHGASRGPVVSSPAKARPITNPLLQRLFNKNSIRLVERGQARKPSLPAPPPVSPVSRVVQTVSAPHADLLAARQPSAFDEQNIRQNFQTNFKQDEDIQIEQSDRQSETSATLFEQALARIAPTSAPKPNNIGDERTVDVEDNKVLTKTDSFKQSVFARARVAVRRREKTGSERSSPAVWAAVKALSEFVATQGCSFQTVK